LKFAIANEVGPSQPSRLGLPTKLSQ